VIFAIKKQHLVDEKVVSRNSSVENYVANFSCIFSMRFLVITIISYYDMALTLK